MLVNCCNVEVPMLCDDCTWRVKALASSDVSLLLR